jgi:protein-L-isoaspartate(D-aspartate) O-methyltransferase
MDFSIIAIVTPIAVPVFCFLVLFADPFAGQRQRMVREDIAARGVKSEKVLRAMTATPRHEFVPGPVRSAAYADQPLPIGHGATISQPYIVALMTELLDPQPAERILEIGTGSGYQAAVLAQLAKEVYTIEIVQELARTAEQALKRGGYENVHVRHGDGYGGWPEKAPFDGIILTAAPPEIPQSLIGQLAPGGTLVAPVGRGYQELVVVEKAKDGKIRKRTSIPVRFVPMVPGKN